MTVQRDIPPDRSALSTEQRNERSGALDASSVAQCVRLMNAEDATVAAAVARAEGAIVAFLDAIEPGFRAGGRLIYLGAGTSGRLGVLDASECPPTFCAEPGRVVGLIAGGDAALRRSSEGMEDDPGGAIPELDALRITPLDAVLGIAAGGTTPYALGGVAHAKRLGAVTGLLTCTPTRGAPHGVDFPIVVDTGPEVVTGSTRLKAGTATKMVLNTISTTLFVRSGKVYENLMVDVRATNAKLRDRAARIVAELTGLARDECFELLDRSGGSAKVAVLMRRAGLSRADAEASLLRAGGSLRAALHAGHAR